MNQVSNVQLGTYRLIAPAGTKDVNPKHEGRCGRKPWEYNVTVAIPHLNTPEPLKLVVELLRLQSERPYIMIIDTGSSPEIRGELEAMRAEDLEVHYIAGHGYRHSSEPVCVALDLAHALCRTKLLFHTHADCFLRRRDFIENTARMCNSNIPVVGYRMSPREWATNEWEWMVGHVALMLYMPSIHRIGASWSYQRTHYAFRFPWYVDGGWPDTETGFNHALRNAGIKPIFLGHDRNWERQIDDNIDHVRSFPGAQLYSPEHYAKASAWMADAMREARERIALWGTPVECTCPNHKPLYQ